MEFRALGFWTLGGVEGFLKMDKFTCRKTVNLRAYIWTYIRNTYMSSHISRQPRVARGINQVGIDANGTET